MVVQPNDTIKRSSPGSARLYGCALAAFIFLFSGDARASDALKLEFTVSNPSDEAKEIDVYVDLPADLRKEDILDADGLDVRYVSPKNAYAVTGKVVLQGRETTLYQVRVNDVWSISKVDLDAYRSSAAKLSRAARDQALELLNKIEKTQNETRSDIPAHIANHRENSAALEKFKRETAPAPSKKRVWPWAAAVAVLAAVAWRGTTNLPIFKKRPSAQGPPATEQTLAADRRKLSRVIAPKDVECRLLIQPEDTPPAEEISVAPRDLSEGGVCLELAETYRSQSVLEIKMKLPSFDEPLLFRGSVVWQKKVNRDDRENRYMTGIQLGEATYEDFQKLKDYVNDRLR